MKYLKERQEYVDRYDKVTVEDCRWAENAITADFVKKHIEEGKDEKELARTAIAFNNLHLWFVMGERYSKKEETINKWMKEDEDHDKFFENTEAPKNIKCWTCSRDMFVCHKQLETHLDKPDRVLFMYDCTLDHTPRRAFYDNGEEWKYEKPKCVKCKSSVDVVDDDTEKLWKSTSICTSCGHIETTEIKKGIEENIDPNYGKDRARFCDEKECGKYVEWMRTAHELTDYLDKQKEKENNKELYDEIAKIKRLKIIEIEQLLTPILEKQNYIKLHFKDPEITRDVVVSFIVHDTKQGREDKMSCSDLQKLIRDTLEGTNWRLMSEGVNYRLGMLEGRLRAYEKEEDLIKLINKK